jgi:hypothetical protein
MIVSRISQRETRSNHKIKQDIERYMRRFFPKADAIVPLFYMNRWYVEVWKDGTAVPHTVPDEALL